MPDSERPLVGIAVLVVRGSTILLGKRKGPIGRSRYGLPGGHLEFGESFRNCAARELYEETGLRLLSLEYLCVIDIILESKHYVDIDFIASVADGEPRVMEKNKSKKWGWHEIDNPPRPLFRPARLAIASYTQREILYHDLKAGQPGYVLSTTTSARALV